MHREKLKQLLLQYSPTDPSEILARTQILEFIQAHPNCFDRSLLEGHVTASAWLLNKDLTKALLLHHGKFDVWCQLGGHCDGDSDVLAVALKEAREESGVNNIVPISTEIFDLDVHEIPELSGIQAHKHYDIRFLLKVNSDEEAVGNYESKAVGWFGPQQELLPTQAESVLRMFRKWRARSEQLLEV